MPGGRCSGSSPVSPWFSFCTCAWCGDNFEGEILERPPNDVRIQLIVEELGGVITEEQATTVRLAQAASGVEERAAKKQGQYLGTSKPASRCISSASISSSMMPG